MNTEWKRYAVIRDRDGIEIGQIQLDSRYTFNFQILQLIGLRDLDGNLTERTVNSVLPVTLEERGSTRDRPSQGEKS